MNDERNLVPEGKTPAGDAGSARGAPVRGRRRLIKGALSAGPVILTLTSRPVLGFEQACVAPSRMISGNFSGFAGPTSCFGNNRQHWYDQVKDKPPGQWPDWAKLDFETELAIPAAKYVSKTNPQEKTVGDVLIDSYEGRDGNANAVVGFASYIISAYLNAVNQASVGNVLKPAQAIHMWNDIVGPSGEYCPQIAMCWNAKGIIDYLNNSGIVPS